MDSPIKEEMLQALKPALKDRCKAEKILNRYWRNKIALIWDTTDVHTAANEREIALTDKEAISVLEELHRYHNKQLGLRWKDVTDLIEARVLGRKLTKAELNQFVKKNILTIHQ